MSTHGAQNRAANTGPSFSGVSVAGTASVARAHGAKARRQPHPVTARLAAKLKRF